MMISLKVYSVIGIGSEEVEGIGKRFEWLETKGGIYLGQEPFVLFFYESI